MAGAALRNVTKVFGERVALDHLDLDIDPGEFFSIVGRSGCGKSTAIRILAGLDVPTTGSVLIGDRDVTGLPARQRGVGLVMQSDSLLTHRTVRRNIRFPLEVRPRDPARDPDETVAAQGGELGIERLLDRKPQELSGGERRAVQLARAIVARPQVLLLDEPLAHMDDGFRWRLRTELAGIQRKYGVTSVLVTADQDDAMRLSDRIAVLVDGRLQQVGTPMDLIDRPATVDVATFFGEPPMNLQAARVRIGDGASRVDVLGCDVRAWSPLLDVYDGREVLAGIRPGDLAIDGDALHGILAVVDRVIPLGHRTDLRVSTASGAELIATVDPPGPPVGSRVTVGLRPGRLHWFDPATGMAVLHPAFR